MSNDRLENLIQEKIDNPSGLTKNHDGITPSDETSVQILTKGMTNVGKGPDGTELWKSKNGVYKVSKGRLTLVNENF